MNNSLAVVETHKQCLHFWLLETNFFAFWWCWWRPFSTLVFSCGIIAKIPSFILCYNRFQEIFISMSSFNLLVLNVDLIWCKVRVFKSVSQPNVDLTLIQRRSRMGMVWLQTSATHRLQCGHLNALHTEHTETWNHSLNCYFHIIKCCLVRLTLQPLYPPHE